MTDNAETPTPTATTTDPDADAAGDSNGQIGYTAALAELDDILHELDGDEVDVDVLGTRVRRAAELLRICRDRITSARFEVEQVVAELDPTAPDLTPPPDDAPDP
jgi:exodeoxyribonuclease VII small subunit